MIPVKRQLFKKKKKKRKKKKKKKKKHYRLVIFTQRFRQNFEMCFPSHP